MDRYWASNPNRRTLPLEGKNLSESTHIHPFFTGNSGVLIAVFDPAHHSGRPFAQAVKAVVAAVFRLNKNRESLILHPVADLSLDTHIRNLTMSVVIGAGPVPVERVAVGVCVGHADQGHKVDLMLQNAHFSFPPHFYWPFPFWYIDPCAEGCIQPDTSHQAGRSTDFPEHHSPHSTAESWT